MIGVTNNRNTARSQAFTYDRLNRIVSAGTSATTGSNCWGYQYTIDAWGNLLAQAGWSPTYNACTEPIMSAVTADIHNRICTACYDPAGNMTSYGGVTYRYDDENRLIVANGVFYYYDGDGNRVAKCDVNTCLTTTGTTGTFYWRGVDGNTLVESNIAGTFQYEYIFFNGERVAQRSLTGTEPVYYYNSDHLGSTSVLTDSSGNIQNESDYYPYGGERVLSNAAPQNYKFTGKERDPESGLDNFGARFDASTIGRFMIPDWAAKPTAVPYANFGNPQSLNLYSYAENNPTTFGDPDGHVPLGWGGGGGDCPDGSSGTCQQNKQQQWAAQAQNTTPVPTSLHVESATDMTRSNPAMNYGIFVDVKYQVLDQNGKPIQSDKMQPMENGTFGNGDKYSGPIVSKKADENHTQADGIFHDKPVGDVHPRQPTDPIKIQQNITIVMGDKEYKVRSQTYTVTSGGYGKGRIVNDSGDIDVTRP